MKMKGPEKKKRGSCREQTVANCTVEKGVEETGRGVVADKTRARVWRRQQKLVSEAFGLEKSKCKHERKIKSQLMHQKREELMFSQKRDKSC